MALKLVRPGRASEKTLGLFSREMRGGGRLQHPHLVSVHAHGVDGGIAWIAMEMVEGAWTLRDFLDEAARTAEVPADDYRDDRAWKPPPTVVLNQAPALVEASPACSFRAMRQLP